MHQVLVLGALARSHGGWFSLKILVHVNQLSLVLADAQHLVNKDVRPVILLHVRHALVNVALQLGSITVGQCSDFVFHSLGRIAICGERMKLQNQLA